MVEKIYMNRNILNGGRKKMKLEKTLKANKFQTVYSLMIHIWLRNDVAGRTKESRKKIFIQKIKIMVRAYVFSTHITLRIARLVFGAQRSFLSSASKTVGW